MVLFPREPSQEAATRPSGLQQAVRSKAILVDQNASQRTERGGGGSGGSHSHTVGAAVAGISGAGTQPSCEHGYTLSLSMVLLFRN